MSDAQIVLTNGTDASFRTLAECAETVLEEKPYDADASTEQAGAADQLDPDQQTERKKPISFYLGFTCLLIMILIVSLDSTCMAVSISTISEQLEGTTFEAFWASLAYMLADVVTLPLYASASDVLGRKIPLYASFVFAVSGSIVFARAQSMQMVILGRAIQGVGGGGLDALNEILIVDITTLKERPLYLGYMAVPLALGTIAGPLMGSAFTEYVSWRWLGWINLPLLGVDVMLAALCLRLKSIDEPLHSRCARVDWIGFLMFVIGTTAAALPLSWAGSLYAWSSWKTIVPLIAGLCVLVAFGFYEAKPQRPMFPHHIFKSRTVLLTLASAVIHGLIVYPATTYLPLLFQSVKLETPFQSAISMLPACCGVIGFALLSGIAVEATRRYLWQFWASWIVTAVGLGLFSLMDRESSVAETAGLQVLAGVGLGALFTVPSLSIQAAVAVEHQGIAAGILIGFRLFGALIGLSISSTVFSSIFQKSLSQIKDLPDVVAALRDSSKALGFIPRLRDLDLPAEVMTDVTDVYFRAFQAIWYVMAAFACLGLVTSLGIEEKSIESEAVGRQHIQHGQSK
ncbi:unnamed protein product [Discula destructiva]